MSQFTCCWCIKLNYSPSCVYHTSFMFDAFLFITWAIYALAGLGEYKQWPHIIFAVFCVLLLVMGIWAIVNLFMYGKGGFRIAYYVMARMIVIISLLSFAIIIFILWIIYGASKDNEGYKTWLGGALYSSISLVVDALILHGYHLNFGHGASLTHIK